MLWRELKVVSLFTICGLMGLAANLLRAPAFSKDPPGNFLAFSSFRSLIFTSPSIFFAAAILFAGFLAVNFRLLPCGLQFSIARILPGTVIAAVVFPVALGGMIAAGLLIYGPLGSDNPSTTAHWRLLLFENAGEIAVIFGGVLTACIMAAAFWVATKRWPGRFWVGMLVIAFGVPLATALIESAKGVPKPLLFIEPTILGIPFLLVIGEPILAGLVGHWLFTAAKSAAQSAA
jgi:hypothetical protein